MVQDANYQDNFDRKPEDGSEQGTDRVPDGMIAHIHSDYVLPIQLVDKVRPEQETEQTKSISNHSVTVRITIPVDDLVAEIEKQIKDRIQQAIRDYQRQRLG